MLQGRDEQWSQIRETLAVVAAGGRAALWIDGAPGSGRTTLLRRVVSVAAQRGVLVMAGAVCDLPTEGPLLVVVEDDAGLPRELPVTRVTLTPLSEEAACRLVADRLGAELTPPQRTLVIAAGGNPLLLTELAEGFRVEGVAVGPDRPRTPTRVQRLIRNRLRTAPTEAWQLLRVAAVLGRSCRVTELTAMTKKSTAQVLPALDALLDAGFLEWVGDTLAFRYELVWWAVLDALPIPIRRALRAERVREQHTAAEASHPDGTAVDAKESRKLTHESGAWASFSGIERAIARLVAEGMTNRQIATRVRLSPHTVNYHLRGLYRRLGISSRAELVRHVPATKL